MKAFWLKNRRGKREAPRLSLFPFLAVLICTMGALVLLLLTVTRQARLQAAREAAAKNAEKQSGIAAETEMVQWRVDQLNASRKDTAAQLAEARLVLGHIEDHERRLRDQFQNLTVEAKKAADEGLKRGRFVSAGEDELRQLLGQIAEAQRRLAAAQQSAANRPKTFAIVPYNGPNSTRRRPIYIECRSDAVVLQPENIIFDESDFDEPLGPGNPLAAAVRAAREQMLLEHSSDPRNDGEPYPLLLIRPDGIAAYECALAAMKSWGSDFGYELINADWQLKYPVTDASVRRAVAQAVDLARQEHARLVAAAPSKYGKRAGAGAYRSSFAGGGQPGQGGEGGSPGFYSSKPADRYGQQYAGGLGGGSGSGNGAGSGAGSGAGGAGSRGAGGASSFGSGGNGSGHAGSGRYGSGSGSGGSFGNGSNSASDEEFAANNPYQSMALPAGGGGGMPGGSPGGGSGSSGSGLSGGGPGGAGGIGTGVAGAGNGYSGGPGGPASGTGAGPGGSPTQPGASNGGAGGQNGGAGGTNGAPVVYSPMFGQNGAQQGAAGVDQRSQASAGPPSAAAYQANGQTTASANAAGMTRPDGYIAGRPNDGTTAPPPTQHPDPTSGVAMVAAPPLRPGEWRPSDDTPPPKPDPEKEKKKKNPYENVELDHRQADWALRDARSHAAAITRPIHVDCFPDRIVLAPEQPGREPHVIICEYDTSRNADKLVAAVWQVMDGWGMAGREMYWRPVLNFYVVPGAEQRMYETVRGLEGSGLVVERKQ